MASIADDSNKGATEEPGLQIYREIIYQHCPSSLPFQQAEREGLNVSIPQIAENFLLLFIWLLH